MHHEEGQFNNQSGLPPVDGLPPSRPRIPAIFTSGSDDGQYNEDHGLFPSYPDAEDVNQKLSRQLLLDEVSDAALAASVPEPPYDGLPPSTTPLPTASPMSTSFSMGDVSISMSPAAMFLSAFSPAASYAPLPDDEGEEVAGYTLGPIIGYGGFSTIRKAISPSGGIVACKIVRRADMSKASNPTLARDRLDNETTIWKSLSHEHILPLFHSHHTPYADFFFMLYCPAGTLYDILKRDGRPALPHDDAGMMFRQVVRGVRYLHEEMGLVHGDLKLENVLVDDMGVCKIGDFGMARRIGVSDVPVGVEHERTLQIAHSKRHGKLGLPIHLSLLRHHSGPRHRNSSPLPATPGMKTHAIYEFPPGSLPYASPELLRPPSASHPYQPHPAQDIWALGVMLYALLTGRLPFMDSFEPRLQMKILHGVYDMPPGLGRGAELVLQGCLEHSVAKRWNIVAVDEVGWSIGWTHEGTDACPADKQLDLMVLEAQEQSRSQSACRSVVMSTSRSRSRPADHFPQDEDEEDERLRERSSSPPAPASRSRSPPAASALSVSLISATSSPSHRGRNSLKSGARSSSRSPSPSVAPATPTDVMPAAASRRFTPFAVPLERDTSRGRKGFRSEPELDVLHESMRWTMSPDTRSSRSRSRGLDVGAPESIRARRSGSTPPVSAGAWNVARGRASVGLSPALSVAHSAPGADGGFVLSTAATPRPIAIPAKAGVRSRSAGGEARGRRGVLL